MKPMPADTTIENYVYPAYESDRLKQISHFAELPEVAGFSPLGSQASKEAALSLPVVQTAVFQDFAKIIKHP
jgi:hypothetical protein